MTVETHHQASLSWSAPTAPPSRSTPARSGAACSSRWTHCARPPFPRGTRRRPRSRRRTRCTAWLARSSVSWLTCRTDGLPSLAFCWRRHARNSPPDASGLRHRPVSKQGRALPPPPFQRPGGSSDPLAATLGPVKGPPLQAWGLRESSLEQVDSKGPADGCVQRQSLRLCLPDRSHSRAAGMRRLDCRGRWGAWRRAGPVPHPGRPRSTSRARKAAP